MAMRSVRDVLPVMHDMAKLERALAALYLACSEQFPEDQEFWTAIQHQEESHARAIEGLASLVTAHPGEFRAGRPFNSTAIQTILSGIASYTDQVRDGRLSGQRAMVLARDLENSVLEARYADIVSTANIRFRRVMSLMVKDTLAHKDLFAAKAERGQS